MILQSGVYDAFRFGWIKIWEFDAMCKDRQRGSILKIYFLLILFLLPGIFSGAWYLSPDFGTVFDDSCLTLITTVNDRWRVGLTFNNIKQLIKTINTCLEQSTPMKMENPGQIYTFSAYAHVFIILLFSCREKEIRKIRENRRLLFFDIL